MTFESNKNIDFLNVTIGNWKSLFLWHPSAAFEEQISSYFNISVWHDAMKTEDAKSETVDFRMLFVTSGTLRVKQNYTKYIK